MKCGYYRSWRRRERRKRRWHMRGGSNSVGSGPRQRRWLMRSLVLISKFLSLLSTRYPISNRRFSYIILKGSLCCLLLGSGSKDLLSQFWVLVVMLLNFGCFVYCILHNSYLAFRLILVCPFCALDGNSLDVVSVAFWFLSKLY